MQDKIWILTEEKPKLSVVEQILREYCNHYHKDWRITATPQTIVPIIERNFFKFEYRVDGFSVNGVDGIFLKTVSGESSFLDFLVFRQPSAPVPGDHSIPVMAIEETKTSDDESRNTGVYQRGSKFVYIKDFYPETPLYMLYNDEMCMRNDKTPSDTSIFGTNILLTLGVTILGKDLRWFSPFRSLNEFINFKEGMRRPPAGNVPITISFSPDRGKIMISGRLSKPATAGNIGHDPNIGALAMISKTIRHFGWTREIEITQHGVSQRYVDRNPTNKFMQICRLLNLTMEGIRIPEEIPRPSTYWHYESRSEKMADILLHVQCENCGMNEVYQNHAGCERGYFKTPTGELLTIPKRDENDTVIPIPDLILCDNVHREILIIEGKQLSTLEAGLREFENYSIIENTLINSYYPHYEIKRGISIFGGNCMEIPNEHVWFYLAKNGRIIINRDAPIGIKNAFGYH